MRKPQTGKPYPAGLAARGDSAALRDALERSPTDLLDELRFIWDLPEGKPIRVIGRVWCKDLDGGGSIWLLDDIEHPATGIGLLYPPLPDALDTLGPRPAAAFVPPGRSREILDFHAVTSGGQRSEVHTSELQSLMRHSSAVFCLKKKTQIINKQYNTPPNIYTLNQPNLTSPNY